jgi:protein arginine N-methyltransferase 1
MYSLEDFASMFSDRVRMDAYTAAIEKAVRPGDTVVDLGCGPGIFAMLACRAGARRVYAIDTNGVVEYGRQLAAANGFSDRIIFLRGDSRQIHLPERVDVIVSDVRGALPLFSQAIETVCDARDRFLAPGGHFMPLRDTLHAAIVTLPKHYGQISQAWKSVPPLDLSSGLPLVLNTNYRHQLRPRDLMSESRAWHTLNYVSEAGAPAQASFSLPVTRDDVGHGIGIWFETELLDGIGYSTAPREVETVYGHLFLPWLEPVKLHPGDICSVKLSAHLVGGDYVWQWETNLPASESRNSIHFVQSTFYGSLFPPSLLKKRAADFVPVLTEIGQAQRWMLQAMDGKQPLESIAADAVKLFPHIFRRVEDAFNQAAELAEKYSR